MRKLSPLAICAILLTGCASARTTMITEDTALITVLGQNDSDRTRVVDKALAEAARVTRDHGFRYFVILDAADASQKGTRVLPGHTIPFEPPSNKSYSSTNLSSSYLGRATLTTPDQRVTYVRLGLDVTIRMYHEGDVDPKSQGVWNTDVILGVMANAR